MKTLGIIDSDRMLSLPNRYKPAHEFCFYLHDALVSMLIEYDQSGVQNDVVNAFLNSIKGNEEKFYDMEIMAFMRENELMEPYKHHILSHNVMALTADMLNFIYEALRCFEKRKFSVAFSLLRKPLKEHLFFLSWILSDEDDFISRFEADNHISFSRVSKEERISIIDKAIKKLPLRSAFDAQTIWNYVYSKKHENGFEPTWQKATHLTTGQGELLKTKEYSLNFIFEDVFDDYYFDFLSNSLPYLFLYITQVVLEAFNRIHPVNRKTLTHLVLISMGVYEALFLDGRARSIRNMLQKQLGDLLCCVHCKTLFKIKKRSAPELFLHESFYCESCGQRSDFPLYWILAKADIELKRE